VVERYREEGPQLQVVGTGRDAAAATQQTLAEKLSGFSRQASALGGDLRAKAGAQAGAEAGLKGPPDLKDPLTRFGQAFNQTAIDVHRATTSADLVENLDRVEQEAGADTKAFDAAAAGVVKGTVSSASPAIQAELAAEAHVQVGRRRARVAAAEQKVIQDDQVAEITRASETFRGAALAAARDGDGTDLLMQRQQYLDLLHKSAQTKENPAGLLDPAKVAKLTADFETDLDTEVHVGNFERVLRDKGTAAAEKVREDFEGTKIKDLGDLTVEARDQVLGRMNAMLGHAYAEEARTRGATNAARDAKDAELRERWGEMEKALAEGYKVEGMDQLVADSRGSKMEGTIVQGAMLARQGAAFALQPPAAQERFLQDREGKLRGRDVNPAEVTQLDAFKSIAQRLQTNLDQDPLGTAVKQGIVDPLPALDFKDPQALQGALQARASASRAAEAHYGRSVPPLTREEAGAVGTAWAAGKASDRLAILQGMSAGLGSRFEDAMAMVHKDGHQTLAWLGGLSQADPSAAREVILGLDLMEADKGLVPKDIDSRSDLESVRNAYQNSKPVVEAITAAYARKSQLASDFSGTYDPDRMAKAIDQVTGGVIEYSNKTGVSQFPAPARGRTSSGDFEDWMDGLSGAVIDAQGGVQGYKGDDALALIRERGRLVSVGPGVWHVAIPAAGSGDWGALYRKNKPGEKGLHPFELRWTEK
jgi:hypothetical protein